MFMDELASYLKNLDPGPVEVATHLERLLAQLWDDLGSDDDGGMVGRKLVGRMEHVEWHPPVLTFTIERHGGTVLGSTRAELQQWYVDIDHRKATCERIGQRQLHRMARRVDVAPIADEIARLITDGVIDHRIRWLGDGRVRVEV